MQDAHNWNKIFCFYPEQLKNALHKKFRFFVLFGFGIYMNILNF